LTFTLNGLSKIAALPQMKLSWIVVTGPKSIVKEAVRRLEVIADSYLSVNTPVQNGLGLFLEGRGGIQSQIMKRVFRNRAFLTKKLKENLPGGELLNSEGGWYATIRLPRIMTDEEWAITFLKKDGVLVYPGHFFDFPMESSLILSLLPPEPLFQEGIEKIIKRVFYSLSIIG
jgi:alanine-synthesizing transaminase